MIGPVDGVGTVLTASEGLPSAQGFQAPAGSQVFVSVLNTEKNLKEWRVLRVSLMYSG